MLIFIVLSPEKFANLTMLSIIPAKLTQQELEAGKRILQQCDLKIDDYNRINSVLFDADKKLNFEKDPVAAEKLFKTIRNDLINCKLKLQGVSPFSDTIIGKITQLVSIASGISTLTTKILDYKKKKRLR